MDSNSHQGLAAECVRALVAGARGAGTRQQVRAAARAFVRRHRRDGGYLRWVLRSVCTSSAIAVALLGLSAAPAGAEIAPFEFVAGSNDLIDAGQNSTPALGDLDGDGDLDLVSGEVNGTFLYYENTGDARTASFAAAGSPLAGQDAGFFSAPALGDLDGDGDLDVVSGEVGGTFYYFTNSGSAANPAFAIGAGNPLAGQDVGGYSTPALGDLDGDGDLDLVAGGSGGFYYFENTGTATAPAFAPRTGVANPFSVVGYIPGGIPALGDLDRDGDLDFVAGENFGRFFTFENTGSAASPAFAPLTSTANPLDGSNVGATSAPALGDLNADGDLDLVSGRFDGLFTRFANVAGEFALRGRFEWDVGDSATSALGDLDSDGDLDLVVGNGDGLFSYFENTGSGPAFDPRIGTANPLNEQDVGFSSAPSLGDLDSDGDLDLVAGRGDGLFSYFENNGSATSPEFALRTGGANPLDGQDVGYNSAPALGDVDGDGDLDLVAGEVYGAFSYFENIGSAATPAFALRTGGANPLDGQVVGSSFSTPALGDVDGDGDLDLVAGEYGGTHLYFENTGSATSPVFVPRTGSANPLRRWFFPAGFTTPALGDLDGDGDLDLVNGVGFGDFWYHESFVAQSESAGELIGAANPLDGEDVGAAANPALGDLDRDGDLDLVAGEDLGGFATFENTGSAILPAFAPRTGAANPLDGEDIGSSAAAPALGDLDADGDLDLVAGSSSGDFYYFENTGGAIAPAFAASALGITSVPGGGSAPALGDLDRDGDLDLVSGESGGAFLYFENTGDAESPAFVERTGAANPLNGQTANSYSRPALGDFDRDGDLDLMSGEAPGTFACFENTGSAMSPGFVLVTGTSNPLDGEDVGDDSAPAAGDLDGDGDLDFVTGDSGGTFSVHYFPEPARALLLAAGIALLTALEHLRRRIKREV